MEQTVPLHPMLVHFPIAAWLIGTAVLVFALFSKKADWRRTAWFLLTVGAVMSIPAALTGRNEFAQLMDPAEAISSDLKNHRNLGNLLPWLMGSLILLRAHAAFHKPPLKIPPWIWCLAAVIISAILGVAGSLGGKLVYINGLGIR